MRTTFAAAAGVQLLAVLAQFFLAGAAAVGPGPVEESFAAHRSLGFALLLLPLLVAGVGALARAPGRLLGRTALISALVLLQIILATTGEGVGGPGMAPSGPILFGLHALNGLAVLVLSGHVFLRARALAADRGSEAAA